MVHQRPISRAPHQVPRHSLFDPGLDPSSSEAIQLGDVGRLKSKRITIGIGVQSGIPFRIEDDWQENRPLKDGTHSKISAKLRRRIEAKKHPILQKVGPWTGSTTFVTKKADSEIKFNPNRRRYSAGINRLHLGI